jgi:flagellar capping protein FliD
LEKASYEAAKSKAQADVNSANALLSLFKSGKKPSPKPVAPAPPQVEPTPSQKESAPLPTRPEVRKTYPLSGRGERSQAGSLGEMEESLGVLLRRWASRVKQMSESEATDLNNQIKDLESRIKDRKSSIKRAEKRLQQQERKK